MRTRRFCPTLDELQARIVPSTGLAIASLSLKFAAPTSSLHMTTTKVAPTFSIPMMTANSFAPPGGTQSTDPMDTPPPPSVGG